jgi:hypothetical protein
MKIAIYCVTVMKDGDPDAPYDAEGAFTRCAARLKELVQAGFAKLDGFRDQHPIAREDADGVANAARPLYVFVAPEWLFRVRKGQLGAFDAREYFTPAQRQKYRELLVSVSTRGDADVLLVGGSMVWIQPADPTARRQLGEATERYVQAKDAKYGIPERQRPQTRTEREAEVLTARKAIVEGGSKEYLGYSEAFAYFNGAERKSVLKSANAGDFSPFGQNSAEKSVAMVHGLGGGSFSLDVAGRKLKTALAICADHIRPVDYGKSVDLYILVSCSQNLSDDTRYVKDGGLILHADCHGWGGAQGGAANPTLVTEKVKPFELAFAVVDIG